MQVGKRASFLNNMVRKPFIAPTLFPAFANALLGVSKHGYKMMFYLNPVTEGLLQFIETDLRRIGPETQRIGKIGKLYLISHEYLQIYNIDF